VPRIVIGIDRGDWHTFIEALTHTDVTIKNDMALAVLAMVRAQLENELLYTVSASTLKTNRNKEGAEAPDRRTINIAKIFCEKARVIALQKEPIGSITEFVDYFKKHADFIERVSFPDRFTLGSNIIAALEWANERIDTLKGEFLADMPHKEKAAPFTEAASIHSLVERWNPQTFESWPIIMGEQRRFALRRPPLQPTPPSNTL
jgi:hypothetical protein